MTNICIFIEHVIVNKTLILFTVIFCLLGVVFIVKQLIAQSVKHVCSVVK